MINFLTYLAEAAEAKLKHITHLEDHHVDDGAEGFKHAKEVLNKAKEHIESGKTSSDLTVKYDGSPSVVYGHHPETGKFFVASKSAFNKNPKINYTHEDIERNHGHAPGLVQKLKAALDHLPKIAPKKGVYQADIMHTPEDHQHHDGSVSFKPNTITYKASGDEAKKVAKSKLGVVTHTQYTGKDFESMVAKPLESHKEFKNHSDVHHITPQYTGSSRKLAASRVEKTFNDHISAAEGHHKNTNYSATTPYKEHVNTYINSTVRSNTKPTYQGLRDHIQQKSQKEIDSVKTEKSKQTKRDKMNKDLEHIDNHSESFKNLLNTHHHLQQAKNILVNHMNKDYSGFEHKIGDKKSNPEGYVVSHNGQLSKLVNRAEFSAANFAPRG